MLNILVKESLSLSDLFRHILKHIYVEYIGPGEGESFPILTDYPWFHGTLSRSEAAAMVYFAKLSSDSFLGFAFCMPLYIRLTVSRKTTFSGASPFHIWTWGVPRSPEWDEKGRVCSHVQLSGQENFHFSNLITLSFPHFQLQPKAEKGLPPNLSFLW